MECAAAARRPGGRRATWLELFFGLIFVVAIAALAVFLHYHLTLGGFLGFALLLVPVGWAWMSFAYYSDQFDTDDTLFRVVCSSPCSPRRR